MVQVYLSLDSGICKSGLCKNQRGINRMQNYQSVLQPLLLYLSNVFGLVAHPTYAYIIFIQICNSVSEYQYLTILSLLLRYYTLIAGRILKKQLILLFP